MSGSLVIDARWLKTGIGRYTLSLLHGVKVQWPNYTCLTQPHHVAQVSQLCDRVIPCDAGIYGMKEQLAVPWMARKFDALYVPHYNIPLAWSKPLLVTIHDLNHLLHSNYRNTWKSRLYARPMLKAAIRQADVIVTPSQYTKAKLNEHLGVDPSRVLVIPCSIAPCFERQGKSEARSTVARKLGLARPFILFVGNCAPNKNVPVLLESLAMLHGKRDDAPLLVVAGGDAKWQPQMLQYARTLGIEDEVVWLARPTDLALAELYNAAMMTVVPSVEEGFGLPVVESMACGTPVVCSRAASLPEVAGDAALFFSPLSCEQLSDAIEHLMDSTATQERLIGAGLARSSLFSQQKFAELQLFAIQQLMSHTRPSSQPNLFAKPVR